MEKDTEQKLVQKSYYTTQELHKKLKIRAVEEDKDMSSIVREALEEYLTKKES